MALTDFKFHLLPKESVLNVHGSLSFDLDAYREYEGQFPPSDDFISYWDYYSISSLEFDIKSILPLLEVWGDTKVYGVDAKSKVEVDSEDVLVKFDVLDLDYNFLQKIFSLSIKHKCVVVLCETGEIISTMKYDDLIDSLTRSKAYRYVERPNDVLNEVKQQKIKH